jgi:hypothetical protein
MEETMSVHTRFIVELLAPAAFIAAAGLPAQAVDNTRYVSVNGSGNACTLAAPCGSLQVGIDATPVGGELRLLDSGVPANNAARVRKSMTISGDGNTVFPGVSITIDDPAAVVALRGLTLNGRGAIANGISIAAAAVVHIESCVIHNFSQDGIIVTAEGVSVFVVSSASRDNGGGGLLLNAPGGASLTIDNSHFDNNAANGVFALAQGSATIRRSTASGNGFNGFQTFGPVMTLDSSFGVGNILRGLSVVGGPALARISNSTFTDNGTGINSSGTVETRQNNTVRGNAIDLSGNALTFIGGT